MPLYTPSNYEVWSAERAVSIKRMGGDKNATVARPEKRTYARDQRIV
jgi:hypothetical protein